MGEESIKTIVCQSFHTANVSKFRRAVLEQKPAFLLLMCQGRTMSRCFFLAVLAILSQSVYCADDNESLCPQELVDQEPADALVVHEGVCYRFVEKERFYHESSESCEEHGGHLVMPKTKELNTFLTDAIKGRGWISTWIGLDDQGFLSIFRWADGKWLRFSTYKNYAGGNGMNRPWGGKSEYNDLNCAALEAADGKWYDYSCGTSFFALGPALSSYVCQYQ